MKKVLVILILVAMLFCLLGCSNGPPANVGNTEFKTAMVRYFDGSSDTVEIERCVRYSNGTVGIITTDGVKMCLGVNNVILIDDSSLDR